MRRVYLDHNATTAVHPEVLAAMMPFFGDHFGNPSSLHWVGREVKGHLDKAREKVAGLLQASPKKEKLIHRGARRERGGYWEFKNADKQFKICGS